MPAFDTSHDGPSLLIQVQAHTATTAVVSMTGDIDHDNCLQVRQAVTDLLRRERLRCIVVDLDGVTFFGAAAVRTLLSCLDDADQHGARLELYRASNQVQSVLAFAGVNHRFRVWRGDQP